MGSKNRKGPWRCSGPAVSALELGSCLGVKGPVAVTKDSHSSVARTCLLLPWQPHVDEFRLLVVLAHSVLL